MLNLPGYNIGCFTCLLYTSYSIEHASDSFRGDLYEKTRYEDAAFDNIDLYHYTKKELQIQVTEINGGSASTQNSIYYPEYLHTSDQTDVFLKGSSCLLYTSLRLVSHLKNISKLLFMRLIKKFNLFYSYKRISTSFLS